MFNEVFDAYEATSHIISGMDPDLCYNGEGYYDPTMAAALNNIANEEAWLEIAKIEAKRKAMRKAS